MPAAQGLTVEQRLPIVTFGSRRENQERQQGQAHRLTGHPAFCELPRFLSRGLSMGTDHDRLRCLHGIRSKISTGRYQRQAARRLRTSEDLFGLKNLSIPM